MRYPTLPTLAPPTPGESLQAYGVRTLTFVLVEGVTATLTDEQLELADHFYPVAVRNPEVLVVAVDRLSAARTEILAALARRRALAGEAAAGVPAGKPREELAGGQLTEVKTPPKGQPPVGQLATIEF